MFLIAGANPPLSLIRKIVKTRNVRYLGYLENLEGWIMASTVCIAPILRGGGTKLKILEYAAAGKPIVATFKAVEGLGMFNNVHGLFYKSVNEEFISGIRRLLKCDQLARELGWNARQLARKYDWTLIGKKLYETYCRLID
jgi:glycosyltransferase involved in cell wall biosynthesis